MGIKIWLVVMAAWGTPATINQMRDMSSRKAVARAIAETRGAIERPASPADTTPRRCVALPAQPKC